MTPTLTPFAVYCTAVSAVNIALNALFLVVTRLKRVEGFQEVLVFMRNIAVGYILLSLCVAVLAPQMVINGSSIILLPHGVLAQLDAVFVHGLASLGGGIYLYTVFSFMIMFLYRYNVTCKTSMMSSVFSRRNIATFMATAGVFCVIQTVMFYYSAVDSTYLAEKLNRTDDVEAILARDRNYQQMNQQQLMSKQMQSNAEPGNAAQYANQDGAHQQQQPQQVLADTQPQKSVGVFGVDYTRNPMIFLSGGIFAFSNVVSSVIILVASLVVACKLRGRQDAMSEQSQSEHQKLTNVLILDAYIPVLMGMVPAINFVLCLFSRIQEFLGILVLSPIPGLFPVLNVFLVPELRTTAFQVCICTYWRNKEAAEQQERKDNANQGNEQLNQAQVTALKNMTDRAGMTAEQRAADKTNNSKSNGK